MGKQSKYDRDWAKKLWQIRAYGGWDQLNTRIKPLFWEQRIDE